MLNLALTNIFNDNREIYLFHRIGNELRILKENSFFPYYYEKSDKGIFIGYNGEKLNKVFARAPYEIPKKRTINSMESDVIYTKRYLIDKINITKANLRYVIFDIETKSKSLPNPFVAPDPITFITCYDNYEQNYTTFCINSYKSEYEMIQSFIIYIRKIQPDLLIAYNAYNFDYPYLCSRFPDFAMKLSPIGKVVKRNNFPAGLSILDYYDLLRKVYKYKNYKLEYVYCNTFDLPYEPKDYKFDVVNDEIKNKNIDDVKKIVDLENKLKLIPYFDELRRTTKVLWEDLTMYSVLIDSLGLQIAKEKGIILPTKPDEEEKLRRKEEDEIAGGYVYSKPGLYDNVHLFDVGGTYPNLILTFNLDPANKRRTNLLTNNVVTVHGIHINQNPNAIVPSICSRLINSRKAIQKQLETATQEEKELLKQKDMAHKNLNNATYGYLLFKSSRLYDKDIASTITYLARCLIRYTKYSLNAIGDEVIASDTDSIFVSKATDYERIESMINNSIIPKWLNHFGKKEGTLKFKYEGTYKNLFILTDKHYIGNIIKNGKEEKVIKGVEIVRSDSSDFTEGFQEDLFDKILNKETKEQIENWIESEVKRMKTLPLTIISFPCKLSKSSDAYKTEGIHVRALRYAQKQNPEWQVNVGQNYYYCFIISKNQETKKAIRHVHKKVEGSIVTEKKEIEIKKDIDVMAFDEFNSIGDNKVDWGRMIKRNILMKAETIFEARGWNTDNLYKICEIEKK
jgi:DNA polymerase elongation subunit (family B)